MQFDGKPLRIKRMKKKKERDEGGNEMGGKKESGRKRERVHFLVMEKIFMFPSRQGVEIPTLRITASCI